MQTHPHARDGRTHLIHPLLLLPNHRDMISPTSPDLALTISPPAMMMMKTATVTDDPDLRLGLESSSPVVVPDEYNYIHHRFHYLHRHNNNNHRNNHHRTQICGREFKRSVRGPRMRWTTTLHAHFVHAVELLGGHDSNISNYQPSIFNS